MWEQVYTPVGGQLAASAACALVPVGAFVYLLAVRRVRGYRAALIALALAILLAVGVWRMPPAMALAAAGYGVAYGLWPIGGVVLAAVFLYKLAETSGLVAVIRASIGQITADRRLQVLLIAYGFGGFLEGVAGFWHTGGHHGGAARGPGVSTSARGGAVSGGQHGTGCVGHSGHPYRRGRPDDGA
jgi:L-lactate permease